MIDDVVIGIVISLHQESVRRFVRIEDALAR